MAPSRVVTMQFSQAQFDAFARMSGDDNPIHVDPEFSARTKFGRTVAHGMMLTGFLNAETFKLLGEGPLLGAQELSFRAPTPADEQVTMHVSKEPGRVRQLIHTPDDRQAAIGWATTNAGHFLPKLEIAEPGEQGAGYKGIAPGSSATGSRTFSMEDVREYVALTGDPRRAFQTGVVPEALLGGMISHLLGVELPGPGTNWLRQRCEFRKPVRVGDHVEATVTVARVRPDKGLIDLVGTCRLGHEEVLVGHSLVWASDVAPS